MSQSSKDFRQSQPHLGNQYEEDSFLQCLLHRLIPNEIMKMIEPDLFRFGGRVANEVWNHGKMMEEHPPELKRYDAWGHTVDQMIVHPAWDKNVAIAAEEGLIAIAYENKFKEYSRLYQFAKLYLFNPSSGMVSCPLAMTDGAALYLQKYLQEAKHHKNELSNAFARLTSRDPNLFWTSGQWMTERGGGSDVKSGTCTMAHPLVQSSEYELEGYKWFTSACSANMALTLARTEPNGPLSCFYLETIRNKKWNGLEMIRTKDKLGTRSLPTTEMKLHGTKAILVSDIGRGVPSISTMVNITRLHNAISACGYMRRMTNLVRDYSHRRVVFEKKLSDQTLHLETLAKLEIDTRACLIFTMDAVLRLGRTDPLLRLLTPLVKLFTAKLAVVSMSEGIECFGGVGYMEDSHLPVLLRDAQVLPIWEGTTNVLSFDLLRVITATPKILQSFDEHVLSICDVQIHGSKKIISSEIIASLNFMSDLLKYLLSDKKNASDLQNKAREIAMSLSRIYIASLLLEHALATSIDLDETVSYRWVFDFPLVSNCLRQKLSREENSKNIALDLDKNGRPRGCGDISGNGTIRSKY